jgi:tryptophan synthase alpha chain
MANTTAPMNRLNKLFATKKENLLSIYFTAGYPELNTTVDIAEALEKAGCGFPRDRFPILRPGCRWANYSAQLANGIG